MQLELRPGGNISIEMLRAGQASLIRSTFQAL